MSTHDTPPPPTEPDWAALPEDSPEALRGLLERCLAKQPDARRRFEMALMTVFGLASIVVLAVALGRYFSAPDAPF